MAQRGSHSVIARCRELAQISEIEGATFRPFLSPATKRCHQLVARWMIEAGMTVRTDGVGNLRAVLPGVAAPAPRTFLIGSHLDTVRNAGAFDGVLGVIMGIALAESLPHPLPFDLEVIGFDGEEGVTLPPFIGSRGLVGTLDRSTIFSHLAAFGVDRSAPCASQAFGYLEFHIEQGPVLDAAHEPVAIVDAIAGQTRAQAKFIGAANHAGTTPMSLRKDALTTAARWIASVEDIARATPGLVATVGQLDVQPNVSNVIPGQVTASLDVRHADNAIRQNVFDLFCKAAGEASWSNPTTVNTIPMDSSLSAKLAAACPPGTRRMISGAGHDAMILAPHIPSAMLFMRSPGGVSHHPSESVLPEDVDLALAIGRRFLESL